MGCLVGKEKKKRKNQNSTVTKGVKTCLLDYGAPLRISKGSILPLPCTAREGQSQFSGFGKGPTSPSPGRGQSVSALHIQHPPTAGPGLAPGSSHRRDPPDTQRYTPSRKADGGHGGVNSLCPSAIPATASALSQPGTARLKLSGSTKGTLHSGSIRLFAEDV